MRKVETRTVVSVFALHPRRIGGIEVFARELSLQLGQHGWRSVLVFSSCPVEKVRAFLELPNTSIVSVSDLHREHWEPALALFQVLHNFQPAVLHLHFTSLLSLYPWLARVCGTRRVFMTDHHSRPPGFMFRRAPWWKRLLARQIVLPLERVFCPSQYVSRCLTEHGLLKTPQCTLLYNGTDLERATQASHNAYLFRHHHRIPPQRIVVTQVSNMIPEKGFADFLQAARLTLQHNPNLHFVLGGDGPRFCEYKVLAHKLHLASRVTFTGLAVDPVMEGIYVASDIVCQLSRWQEAFGFTIAEAMAASKPVIASRVGGIPELVHDGQNGYMVEPGDSQMVADLILKLADNVRLRETMGQVGRQSCNEQFNVQNNVAELISAYGIR